MTAKSDNRRGFLGLSAAAAVSAGLSACTGSSGSSDASGSSGQTSNELRLFTYEDNATIDTFKVQIKRFDRQNGTTTTVNSLPGSGGVIAAGAVTGSVPVSRGC